MTYEFISKNLTVSDGMKAQITAKLDRLERMIHEDNTVRVVLSLVKLENTVEVTILLNNRTLRAQVRHNDLLTAVDEVVDILQRQVVKYKGRLQAKKRDNTFRAEYEAAFADGIEIDEDPIQITRTKHFHLKPMDADEAAMEMELTGHSFYVFKNIETGEVSVLYRRANGEYGLIETEV